MGGRESWDVAYAYFRVRALCLIPNSSCHRWLLCQSGKIAGSSEKAGNSPLIVRDCTDENCLWCLLKIHTPASKNLGRTQEAALSTGPHGTCNLRGVWKTSEAPVCGVCPTRCQEFLPYVGEATEVHHWKMMPIRDPSPQYHMEGPGNSYSKGFIVVLPKWTE